MSGLWNAIRSFFVAIVGLIIAAVGVLGYWVAYDLIADWMSRIPVVGPVILDWLVLLNLPGGKYLFPALGIFLIVWAVALGLRRSWARITGIAFSILAIAYLIAFVILIIPFWDTPVVTEYGIWIAVVWFALLCMFGYQAYSLAARRETELSYAAKYLGKQVVRTCDRCGSALDQRGRCPKCENAPRPTTQPRPRSRDGRASSGDKAAAKPQPSSPTPAEEQVPSKPASHLLARLVASHGKAYEIRKSQITVGRAPGNDIVLNETTVSANHAEISHRQGEFTIRDLGSTNGTFVNDTKVDRSRMENGSKLRLGRVEFVFEIKSAD